MKTRAAWMLVLAWALIPACAGTQKAEPLDRGLHRYHDSLRWQRLSQAAQYIPPRQRGAFFDERMELEEDLRITMYDIRRVDIGETENHAIVYVEYTWYSDSEGTVHSTVAEQRWRRHGDQWLLLEERRSRGEPMPGLPEPAPKPGDVADAPGPDTPEKEP